MCNFFFLQKARVSRKLPSFVVSTKHFQKKQNEKNEKYYPKGFSRILKKLIFQQFTYNFKISTDFGG